jgi:hypothetical protein
MAELVCQALPAQVNRAGVYHLVHVAELDFFRCNLASANVFLDGQALRKLGRVAACLRAWPGNTRTGMSARFFIQIRL